MGKERSRLLAGTLYLSSLIEIIGSRAVSIRVFRLCFAEAATTCSDGSDKTSSKKDKRRRLWRYGRGRWRDGAGDFFINVSGPVVDV